ncbi:beta-glucosidase family protein [Nocardioides conyzicola]|uniref:Glycoside hydrolase family 3 C-terminal domain-containing protein n=1 Tax=Nocardioides conyzicola TaxID=1651781 RepID=A0ABP8WPR3_9ACTN
MSSSLSAPDLAALVARLTLEQKVRLLTGADFWALYDEPTIGLRRIVTSDGPAGVRGELWDERDPSTNIPSPTAIAASWDPELTATLGRLLAHEARRKGVDVVLAPTVNLHRSPYGGRHFECFSEDPVLTGSIGAALVEGLQSQGVAATVKHFVANDSETDRLTVDARVDERPLRELYLAPFETIVRDAGAWSVMAAYNTVNGHSMTESPMLRDVLHEEWGFDGVTMTDWYAGRTTEPAARGGLDLVMPGPTGPWREALVTAVREGRVDEDAVDAKVLRLLRLAARVGALADGPEPAPVTPWTDDESDALVQRAAAAGFVLVRNAPVGDAPVLPADPTRLRRVAVIGPNAREARFLGGGSALVFPPATVSPLAGLIAALGPDVEVTYCLGARGHERVSAADADLLTTPDGERGIRVEFRGAGGEVLGVDRRLGSAFNWNNAFEGVDPALITEIALDTVVTADQTGEYRIGASGVGRYRLRLDDRPAFDELLELAPGADPVEGLMRPPQEWATVPLTAGQAIRVSLVHVVKDHTADEDLLVSMQLAVDCTVEDDDASLAHAVTDAAAADLAVVVVGTSEEVESEGFDRTSLALPGRQDELVHRVAAVRPETVVVVNAGAPVLMPWRDEVAATLLAWFPGQEFGGALADVLLGQVEPGGRLPTTWPAAEDSVLPSTTPVNGRLDYTEGLHLGYRRFLRDGVEPAYWFGHGLGYTTWSYDEVAVAGEEVSVTVTNTGPRAGRELVQVYLARPDSTVERPVRWLAAHTWVEAEPGTSATARVVVPQRAFEHWDGGWNREAGAFIVEIGRSAADIVLRTEIG